MKILSVFTHPHVVPNLYVFICSAEHTKEDIWKNVLIKQTSFPIDYTIVGKNTYCQWGMRSV